MPGLPALRRRRRPRSRPWPHLRAPQQPARFRAPGAPTAVIGHMGAPSVAPTNSREGFLAAQALGADGLELDLVAIEPGLVIVAHDRGDARSRPEALDIEALTDLLAEPPLADLPVLIDVKSLGTERAVAAALVGARLTERAVISTTDPQVLRAVRLAAPGATRSQTFPRSRRDPQRSAFSRGIANARRPFTKAILPMLVRRAASRHGLAAVTVHHLLVTPALCRMLAEHRIELLVWTVDDPIRTAELLDLGVDGIITNDPEVVLDVRASHTPTTPPAPRSKVGIWFTRGLHRR